MTCLMEESSPRAGKSQKTRAQQQSSGLDVGVVSITKLPVDSVGLDSVPVKSCAAGVKEKDHRKSTPPDVARASSPPPTPSVKKVTEDTVTVSAWATEQPKASNTSRKPSVDNTLRMALTPSKSLAKRPHRETTIFCTL